MQVIGITGVRSLTEAQECTVRKQMRWELLLADKVHVGCARGVDALGRQLATDNGKLVVVHETEGWNGWQLQQRSKRMVDALWSESGELHAWVNKQCPDGVTVNRWQGSGTWGTVRYAIAKGVPVEIHWLIEPCELPDWMFEKQLSLV